MPFRDSIIAISPPFLREEGGTAEAIQYATGTMLDGIAEWMGHAVKSGMPGIGTNDALYLVGKDMGIDRGPTETDDHYIERLRNAIASHRVQGSPVELLKQLSAWFYPSTDTPLRLVTNNSVWHEINLTTLVVTKTVATANWQWDAYVASRYWCGWVIIDSSVGPWTADIWDLVGLWGDGGTWGSDATVAQVKQIQSWVEKWKPAHTACVNIIVTFDAGLFNVADTSPPNPDEDGYSSLWQAAQNAMFWDGVS
jgi:hypothetical protein